MTRGTDPKNRNIPGFTTTSTQKLWHRKGPVAGLASSALSPGSIMLGEGHVASQLHLITPCSFRAVYSCLRPGDKRLDPVISTVSHHRNAQADGDSAGSGLWVVQIQLFHPLSKTSPAPRQPARTRWQRYTPTDRCSRRKQQGHSTRAQPHTFHARRGIRAKIAEKMWRPAQTVSIFVNETPGCCSEPTVRPLRPINRRAGFRGSTEPARDRYA